MDFNDIVSEYSGGYAIVNAVPGSGKTSILAKIAAVLQNQHARILVVTYTNSGVISFQNRLRSIRHKDPYPLEGCDIVTLHSLAKRIIDYDPYRIGLSPNYEVADEGRSKWMLYKVIDEFRTKNQDEYKKAAVSFKNIYDMTNRVYRFMRFWMSKINLQDDQYINNLIYNKPELMLCRKVVDIYQRMSLASSVLDFDSMIYYAINMLNKYDDIRDHFCNYWSYILEDESQDSTISQIHMLSVLSQKHGNWIRVGDPNQSIMTTFSPVYAKRLDAAFQIASNHEKNNREIKRYFIFDNKRSFHGIIRLANALVNVISAKHTDSYIKEKAFVIQGDMQPKSNLSGSLPIYHCFKNKKEEYFFVFQDVANYMAHHPHSSCAILVPNNQIGAELLKFFSHKTTGTDLSDHLSVNIKWGKSEDIFINFIHSVFKLLDNLSNKKVFIEAIQAYIKYKNRGINSDYERNITKYLSGYNLKDFLGGKSEGHMYNLDNKSLQIVEEFSNLMRDVLKSYGQTPDAIIGQIATIIGASPAEYSVVLHIKKIIQSQYHIYTGEFKNTLMLLEYLNKNSIYEAFTDQPNPSPGYITISTVHKSKGLEWDRVYLVAVDETHYPYRLSENRSSSEFRYDAIDDLAYYIVNDQPAKTKYDLERYLICEKMRLLYVGITRSRHDLIMTSSGSPHKLIERICKSLSRPNELNQSNQVV
ncbi:MAG: ATP-dependent helicase [Methylacidiphilales bacterium]|nr:ATP-dependent helicase [Candidatus Methylacidiphilales bacterium]